MKILDDTQKCVSQGVKYENTDGLVKEMSPGDLLTNVIASGRGNQGRRGRSDVCPVKKNKKDYRVTTGKHRLECLILKNNER